MDETGLIKLECGLAYKCLEKEAFGALEISRDYAATAFFELAQHYYKHNFGTFPKAEIDQLMFELVYEVMKGKSTLEIAMQLGITPNRVEGYMERMALRDYDYGDIDWWKVVVRILAGCKPIVDGISIKITLPSRFLKYELADALDQAQYHYDFSLNSKNISISTDQFISLIFEVYFQKRGPGIDDPSFSDFENAFRGDFELEDSVWSKVLDQLNAIVSNASDFHSSCLQAGKALSLTASVVGPFAAIASRLFIG